MPFCEYMFDGSCIVASVQPPSSTEPYLSDEDLMSLEKFHKNSVRNQSATGLYLLRKHLSEIHPSSYKEYKIKLGERGKPYIPAIPYFHFSISHASDLVAFCYDSIPCGIDIETTNRFKMRLVQHFFHKNEIKYIESLPESLRDEYFTRFWTAKEAYVKMSGEGISDTFDDFYFDPDSNKIYFGNNITLASISVKKIEFENKIYFVSRTD